MSLLEGRHALVTGAANGIGKAVADRFRAEGARVSGVDIAPGVEFQADLAETESLPALVDAVVAAAGPIDILASVAGIYEPQAALDLTLDAYRRTLAVNLDAPIVLAQHAGRGMVERGYGRIVSITSVHGQFSEALGLSYDVSKAGLQGATRTLAIELGPHGVLVNAVAPGFVNTRMSIVDGQNELESDWFKTVYVKYEKLPLRRAGEPHEIAAHVAWLCSDQNTYLTGQVVTVDGGVTVTF